MTLAAMTDLGAPELPPDHFYRVTQTPEGWVRVEVRRDTGPSWWRDRSSVRLVREATRLRDYGSGAQAVTAAAKRCVFRRGYGRKRAWLVRVEAAALVGDHR